MKDVLLELISACPHETANGPDYFWDLAERKWPGLVIQYTWTGEGRVRRRHGIQTCAEAQALLMRHGDATQYFYPRESRVPWSYAWINFTGAEAVWGELIRRYGVVVTLDPYGESVELLQQIARLYQSKSFQDRFHTSDLLGRMVSSLARELGLAGRGESSFVRQSQDYMRDHHRRPINIKEVAAHFRISREHFTRIFLEESGETPAVFLRKLRLQTARQLLRGSPMSIREVAEQSGFGSSTHFCRAFRAQEGQTPESFRDGITPTRSWDKRPRARGSRSTFQR